MTTPVDSAAVEDFLAQHRFAVIGASADPRNFGHTVYCALRDHGYDVVGVHPSTDSIDGATCYPDLASVEGELDGAIVMVNKVASADVVRECAARHVPRVWLFKGLGGPGAVSEEAVTLGADLGITVVAGACPLMFLEPLSWFHRAHRTMRRVNGSLAKAA